MEYGQWNRLWTLEWTTYENVEWSMALKWSVKVECNVGSGMEYGQLFTVEWVVDSGMECE